MDGGVLESSDAGEVSRSPSQHRAPRMLSLEKQGDEPATSWSGVLGVAARAVERGTHDLAQPEPKKHRRERENQVAIGGMR